MVELVTGHAGKAHATAEQAAGLNAGILGLDDYVLDVHDKLKITVVSANKVTIGTGELVMQGRHVSQSTPEDLIVTNGSQGQKRNDLIVCRYAKGSQNIESAKLVVVRGTPTTGTPTDPAVNTTSPLDGGTTYDMPLYRIPLDGITIGTPVALFNVLKPMSDVWDSLTQTVVPTTWSGSTYSTVNSYCRVIARGVDDLASRRGNVGKFEPAESCVPMDLNYYYRRTGRGHTRGVIVNASGTIELLRSARVRSGNDHVRHDRLRASIRAVWSLLDSATA